MAKQDQVFNAFKSLAEMVANDDYGCGDKLNTEELCDDMDATFREVRGILNNSKRKVS